MTPSKTPASVCLTALFLAALTGARPADRQAATQHSCDLTAFIARYRHLAPPDSLVLDSDSLDSPLSIRVNGLMAPLAPSDWQGEFCLAALLDSRGDPVAVGRIPMVRAAQDSAGHAGPNEDVPAVVLDQDLRMMRATKYDRPRYHDWPVWVFIYRTVRRVKLP